jgi:hypothetical protein
MAADDTREQDLFLIDHRNLIVPGPSERIVRWAKMAMRIWMATPLALKILLVAGAVFSPAVCLFILLNVIKAPQEWMRLCIGLLVVISVLCFSAWAAFGFVSPIAIIDAVLTGASSYAA